MEGSHAHTEEVAEEQSILLQTAHTTGIPNQGKVSTAKMCECALRPRTSESFKFYLREKRLSLLPGKSP